MQMPGSGSGYRVEERVSFAADWQRGVEEGWINPMADHVTLQMIKEVLSRMPRTGGHVRGDPENVLVVSFPRSVRYEQGRSEIIYEVLEDDRTVWLERIRPVG